MQKLEEYNLTEAQISEVRGWFEEGQLERLVHDVKHGSTSSLDGRTASLEATVITAFGFADPRRQLLRRVVRYLAT